MSDTVTPRLARVEAAVQKMGEDGDMIATELTALGADLASLKTQLDQLKGMAAGQLSTENNAFLDNLVVTADAAVSKADAAAVAAAGLRNAADAMAGTQKPVPAPANAPEVPPVPPAA